MYITYKYRLLTRKSHHRRLDDLIEQQRQLYNAALEERIDCYRKTGKSLSLFDQIKSLTECRKALPEMAAVSAHLQRGTLTRLDKAFKAFFRRVKKGDNPGFPRFKGKGIYKALEWTEFKGIRFDGKYLISKAFGAIRVHMHRDMPGTPKSARIVRDTNGWYVCFSVPFPAVEKVEVASMVGIDLGLTDLATLTTGEKIPTLRAARKAEAELRRENRALARTKRGSAGRHKAKQRVARVHRKTRNIRHTYAHQQSAALVRNHDLIAVENLNIDGLAKSRLAKSVADAGWGTLLNMIAYKAERAGKTFIRVAPQFTSQDCSGCGHRVPKTLKQRTHACPECGLTLDRDVNAAWNILHKAVAGLGDAKVAGYGALCPANIR